MLSGAQTAQFKKSLEKEKALLEAELSGLGTRNPANPSDWVTGKPEGDEFGADRNDNADVIEDMEEDSSTVSELEGRLNLVVGALEHIEEGTYGVCEVCGADIEHDRLAANHAATTCKAHMQ
jgi:RNA polymerase-binding transcription factor DksA